MAHVTEEPQSSSEPLPSNRTSARHWSNVTHSARPAGVLLLLVWVGPVTFAQTDGWRVLSLIGALRVAVEDIETVTVELPSGISPVGTIALSVVVSVVVVLVVIGIMIKSAVDGCESGIRNAGAQSLSGVRLTTHPFDRSRGCFVGDALAVAD